MVKKNEICWFLLNTICSSTAKKTEWPEEKREVGNRDDRQDRERRSNFKV